MKTFIFKQLSKKAKIRAINDFIIEQKISEDMAKNYLGSQKGLQFTNSGLLLN